MMSKQSLPSVRICQCLQVSDTLLDAERASRRRQTLLFWFIFTWTRWLKHSRHINTSFQMELYEKIKTVREWNGQGVR